MHSLQQIAAFAETAKHGSFAAAARVGGSAPSSLAKAVARLEEGLGVRLFHRTTRQVSLTPDGERLYERCQRLLLEIDELQAEASGVRDEPRGLLRIDMPIVLGKRFVLPVLADLLRRHPGLSVDVRLQDGYVDLVKEGIDAAVRIGELKDSTLVSRRLSTHAMVLVASPAYLAARGTPRHIDQLASHDAVVFRLPSSGRDRDWRLRQEGREIQLLPKSRVRVNDGEGLVQAALLGLGLVQVPDYFVHDELARGALTEVLKQARPQRSAISIVYPGARLVPNRVRVLIEAVQGLNIAGGDPPVRRSPKGRTSARETAS